MENRPHAITVARRDRDFMIGRISRSNIKKVEKIGNVYAGNVTVLMRVKQGVASEEMSRLN